MGLLLSTRRALIGGVGTYSDKVLGYGPIAYWPLDEPAGTVARCLVDPAQNGTYSSDVSGWPVGAGIGDGNSAPQFDGGADSIDVLTATLQAAFNGDTGTVMVWRRAAGVGVWTDAVTRYAYIIRDGGYTNMALERKSAVNNTFTWWYAAGGVNENMSLGGHTDTIFIHTSLTWDKPSDAVISYEAGVAVANSATLGNWVGPMISATIGSDGGAGNFWHGGLAHCAVWDRVLTPGEIASLAVV